MFSIEVHIKVHNLSHSSIFNFVFLFRTAHLAYWSNHPRAVCIIEKHREKLNTWIDSCQVSHKSIGHFFHPIERDKESGKGEL